MKLFPLSAITEKLEKAFNSFEDETNSKFLLLRKDGYMSFNSFEDETIMEVYGKVIFLSFQFL